MEIGRAKRHDPFGCSQDRLYRAATQRKAALDSARDDIGGEEKGPLPPSGARKEGGDPVADWERGRVIALKEEGPRTTLMRQPTVANGQVFRCGETLRQRRDRDTENRTHHVGTVPAV